MSEGSNQNLAEIGLTSQDLDIKPTTKEVKSKELLKQPALLCDASYLLLSLEDLTPKNVAERISGFLKDTQNGKVSPEDARVIQTQKLEHETKYNNWKALGLHEQHQYFERSGFLTEETENLDDLYCIHCTNFLPSIDGTQPIIKTTFRGSEGEWLRTTVHFSLNHTVEEVANMGRTHTWTNKDYVIITPFRGVIELNGTPYGMLPEDTWWGFGANEGVKLPPGTKIIARKDGNGLADLKKIDGLEIIEVDGEPHSQAYNVMQEKGIKIISPRKFKGKYKIADQLGCFYGSHFGSTYLKAESMIERGDDNSEKVVKIVNEINKCNEPTLFPDWVESVKRYRLIELFFEKYFNQNDFPDLNFTNDFDVTFDEIIQAMHSHYYDSRDHPKSNFEYQIANSRSPRERFTAQLGWDMFGQLTEMAKLKTNFLPTSENLLRIRHDRIKNNLDIIPPYLIGTYMTLIYKNLSEIE